jgi:hypothetical protein
MAWSLEASKVGVGVSRKSEVGAVSGGMSEAGAVPGGKSQAGGDSEDETLVQQLQLLQQLAASSVMADAKPWPKMCPF